MRSEPSPVGERPSSGVPRRVPGGREAPAAPLARPASRARDEAARHSLRVRRLRFWLPLAGIVAALAVVGWIVWTQITARFGLANVLFTRDGVTMVDPHISGQSLGRAYEMVARRGVQSFDNAKKVRFEEVSGRVEMQERRWVKLTAPIGLFDGTAQTLRLEGGVDVVTSDGYRIKAKSVDMQLDKGDMRTSEPVEVDTGSELLTAAEAHILENGHQMVFTGGVRLQLSPKVRTVAPTAATDAPPEAQPQPSASAKKETP
jgi:lipopolysaccharide export system protein LptC